MRRAFYMATDIGLWRRAYFSDIFALNYLFSLKLNNFGKMVKFKNEYFLLFDPRIPGCVVGSLGQEDSDRLSLPRMGFLTRKICFKSKGNIVCTYTIKIREPKLRSEIPLNHNTWTHPPLLHEINHRYNRRKAIWHERHRLGLRGITLK